MCAAWCLIWWFASLEKVGKEWKVISFIHGYFSRFFFLWELELQLAARQWWFGIPRYIFHTIHQQYMMISWYNPLFYLTNLPFIRHKHSRKPPSCLVSRPNSRNQLLPPAGPCKQSQNGVTGTPGIVWLRFYSPKLKTFFSRDKIAKHLCVQNLVNCWTDFCET